MIKFLLKMLLLPFVVVWRLIFGVIKLLFLTEVLLGTISLFVLAALAYVIFKGGDQTIPRLLNLFHSAP